jgi:TonB-linked SusC/RagA family outer membrane protein
MLRLLHFAFKQIPKRHVTAFVLLLLPAILFAQVKTVTGTVTDETGKPVSGASVLVKKSSTGTATNDAGRFSINASPSDELVISAVNYEPIEIAVKDQTTLSVALKAKAETLDDVVVVGYATQRKANVTGSVSSISAKDLDSRPVTNVSSALTGLAPGLRVTQGSGDPRQDGASIRVRGLGTINNNTPLFLVDGIQVSSIDQVNPNDVESISILKDAASASIYGALGANGVILITTKKGTKGKLTVRYDGLFSSSAPSNMLDMVSDYPTYMRRVNESAINVNNAPIFTDATINAWDSANKIPNELNPNGVPNYVAYPNTDWFDAIFQHNLIQNHNVSLNGGTDKTNFLVSLGYLDNPGTMPQTGTKRYQLRLNLEAKPSKILTVGTQTYASIFKAKLGNTDNLGVWNYLHQSSPGVYPYWNGKYGAVVANGEASTANNILRILYLNDGRDLTTRLNSTLYAHLHLFKGFTAESRLNYQAAFAEYNSHPVPIPRWNIGANQLVETPGLASLQSVYYAFSKSYNYTFDEILRYTATIGNDHEIGAIAGFSEYYANGYNFDASKLGLLSYDLYTFATSTTPNTANGSESDRALQSFFGRINYGYKNKYLLEANFRRDGASQFSPDTRWGNYKSFSAGWIISRENFFSNLNQIRFLKLRASWGDLGNNRVNDYQWQSNYNPVLYSFNGTQFNGLAVSAFADPNIRWETTQVADLGLDATLLKGNLDLSFDVYKKRTFDILTSGSIAYTAGTASAPVVNGPEVVNNGFEVSANYRARIQDFRLTVGGNFSYNNNTVTKYRGKYTAGWTTDASGKNVYLTNRGAAFNDPNSTTPIVEDHLLNDYFLLNVYRGNGSYFNGDGSVNVNGGPKDGMIRTAEDLAWVNAMKNAGYKFQPVNTVGKAQLYYGDLLYADNNQDSIYGNTDDRVFMGTSSIPKFIFGFSLNAAWKGFDFSMIWAGNLGMKYYWNSEIYNRTIMRSGNSLSKRVSDNRYYYNEADPNDPNNNINGFMPRLKWNSDNINTASSDYWLYDAGYVKLKNIQLGYTIPENLTRKVFISNARIFVSGENLLTITNFPGLDPELGSGIAYPTMKQYAVGVNISF